MAEALGTIETIGYVVAIAAADAAAKAANVRVLGAENVRGGGRVTVKMVGDVGAVKAAISAAIAAAERIGKVAAWQVIPRPHDDIAARAQLVDLGAAKPAPRPAPPTPAPAAPVVAEAPAAPIVAEAPAPVVAEAPAPVAPEVVEPPASEAPTAPDAPAADAASEEPPPATPDGKGRGPKGRR